MSLDLGTRNALSPIVVGSVQVSTRMPYCSWLVILVGGPQSIYRCWQQPLLDGCFLIAGHEDVLFKLETRLEVEAKSHPSKGRYTRRE